MRALKIAMAAAVLATAQPIPAHAWMETELPMSNIGPSFRGGSVLYGPFVGYFCPTLESAQHVAGRSIVSGGPCQLKMMPVIGAFAGCGVSVVQDMADFRRGYYFVPLPQACGR